MVNPSQELAPEPFGYSQIKGYWANLEFITTLAGLDLFNIWQPEYLWLTCVFYAFCPIFLLMFKGFSSYSSVDVESNFMLLFHWCSKCFHVRCFKGKNHLYHTDLAVWCDHTMHWSWWKVTNPPGSTVILGVSDWSLCIYRGLRAP